MEQLRDILQKLLEDRFQLKVHRNTREASIYPKPSKQLTEIHLDPTLLDNYTARYQLADRIFEISLHTEQRLL